MTTTRRPAIGRAAWYEPWAVRCRMPGCNRVAQAANSAITYGALRRARVVVTTSASCSAHKTSPINDDKIALLASHTTVLLSESPSSSVTNKNSTTADSENVMPRTPATNGSLLTAPNNGRNTTIHTTNQAPSERIEASARMLSGSRPMRRWATNNKPSTSVICTTKNATSATRCSTAPSEAAEKSCPMMIAAMMTKKPERIRRSSW